MKRNFLIFWVVILFFGVEAVLAHDRDYWAIERFIADPFYSDFMSRGDFHAGIHSGSWTIKREHLLHQESKDKYRSCRDPYCNRCSEHLADYGHEYQYLSGVSQRQLWYRGTAGGIAPVRQFGYEVHGFPYARRGQPAAVMSKEYVRVLNHAIWEQVQARNAVADEESAEDRVGLLAELRDAALAQLQKSRNAWELAEQSGSCIKFGMVYSPCSRVFRQTPVGNTVENTPKNTAANSVVETTYTSHSPPFFGLCEYCAAKAQFLFDQNYVMEVEKELTRAIRILDKKSVIADEAVRIALLSKSDADKATRFKRIQMKPPKYQEVLAAQESAKKQEPVENNTKK
ncbi:MAG: hypothetical protein LBC20_07330 [Planctomycetaceae bacterium]|jgi:hypothetical protein|nr:hypothetical protein [Planctomycetaceae bacterium]